MSKRSYDKVIVENFLEDYEEKMKDPNFKAGESEHPGTNNLGGFRFTLRYIWEWIVEFKILVFAVLFNIAFVATAMYIGLPYESLGGIALSIGLLFGIISFSYVIITATYKYIKSRMRVVESIRNVFPESTKKQALHIASLIRKAREANDKKYKELMRYVIEHNISYKKTPKKEKKPESPSTWLIR